VPRVWHHRLVEIAIPFAGPNVARAHGGQSTTAVIYRAQASVERPAALILAHGAGAGQRHPFMVAFARGLSERGLDVLTFNFPYMQQGRRAPDRMPELLGCYDAVIAWAREGLDSARERLFIGGKSMGGRAATHVGAAPVAPCANGDAAPLAGIVLLGYPLHPPGRPDQLRDAHLPDVKQPMLFVQRSRDTFGTPLELAPVIKKLSPLPTLHVVEGGDHSFKISGRDAAKAQVAVSGEIQDVIAGWIASQPIAP
jgi:predicted alpha/beta-hydrolase family hydrolase